jgi:hypothetical protein
VGASGVFCPSTVHVRVFHGVEIPRSGISPDTMPERESLGSWPEEFTPRCFIGEHPPVGRFSLHTSPRRGSVFNYRLSVFGV